MEIIILIIAGIVVYYLYVSLQEYLKNPLHKKQEKDDDFYHIKQDPYAQEIKEEKNGFEATELGVMLAIINQLPHKDKITQAFDLILHCLIKQYCVYHPQISQQEALDFLKQENQRGLDDWAKEYLKLSYAEYKKRLKFVELLLLLAYLDGALDDLKKEYILDVAAILQLDNEDFNQLYDAFEKQFSQEENKEIEKSQDKDLQAVIQEQFFDIFDPKNHAKSLLHAALQIREALRTLP